MKKILTLFLMVICFSFSNRVLAQMTLLTSPNYGQVFDVTYDPVKPNVLYAHTVTNHVVKSSDNGQNWEVLYSFPIDQIFGTIKDLKWTQDQKYLSFIVQAEGSVYNQIIIIDPSNGSVVKNINSPNGSMPGNLIVSYSVTGSDQENILLHTTFMFNFGLTTDIFYTENGGGNWQKVYSSFDNDGIHVNNVAIHPSDPKKIFLSRGFSPDTKYGGLFVSEDAGSSWTEKLAGTNFSALAFDPADPQKMFLGSFYLSEDQRQNLYRSNDGGSTWNVVPISWTDLSTNSIQKIVINQKNNDEILILEENEIVISKDGGNSWTNYVHPNDDLENTYYYGLNATFNPSNNSEVIISSNFYPFHSLDGGITMTRFKNPFANNTGRVSFHKGTEKHLYYGLRRGFMHKNFQSGEETAIGHHPINFFPNFNNNGLFADPLVAGRVYISTSGFMGSSFAVSNNHGVDYSTGYSGFGLNIMKIATSKQNTDHAWVSFSESVRKFDFTDMSAITSEEVILPSFGVVFGIIVDENNENNVLLSQDNNVYKTTDGGQTWTASESGLGVLESGNDYIYDIKSNPFNKNQLLLSTTKGIFLSDDAGIKWNHVYNGNVINNAEFSPYKNGVIVATSNFMDGTGDGYAYPPSQVRIVYSKDFGQAWTEISPEDLNYLFSESASIDFTPDEKVDVYISTSDLGLIQYKINLQTLSVDINILSNSDLVIYPNPTSDYVTVLNENVKDINVFDFNGRSVLRSSSKKVDLSNLPRGVYILNATLNNGKSISKKVVRK
ncbi:T9SS type A sorting domain-containing protein [Chryseobacterium sp. KACC 21268]|nr:T9SS type A sorting domain-containing protein [Chryseobacterium sp. KACC 21268]